MIDEIRSVFLIALLLFCGVMLVCVGSAMLFLRLASPAMLPFTILGAVCVTGGVALHKSFRQLGRQRKLKRSLRDTSPLAEELVPMLYGDYTPYVVEAAQRLGENRETTAVPALLHVLEQTVNTQPPGWRDIAEALVVALGRMGDRTALPLLYRLLNVRGIGLISAVREAIDRIEPETSLLRASSADMLAGDSLLRPAEAGPASDPALLLRSSSESSS